MLATQMWWLHPEIFLEVLGSGYGRSPQAQLSTQDREPPHALSAQDPHPSPHWGPPDWRHKRSAPLHPQLSLFTITAALPPNHVQVSISHFMN